MRDFAPIHEIVFTCKSDENRIEIYSTLPKYFAVNKNGTELSGISTSFFSSIIVLLQFVYTFER